MTSTSVPRLLTRLALGSTLLGAGLPAVLAQTPPDAGSLLRQIEQQRPAPPAREAPGRPSSAVPTPAAGQATVRVTRFAFIGHTQVDTAVLERAVEPFLNRPLSFSDLQRAAAAAAEACREAGWVVRALLPQQDITGGTVTIQIVEAVMGEVRIDGNPRRVEAARLRRIVAAAQPPGARLSAAALDRALLLIDDLPGVSARGSLAEGRGQAQTDLLLTATDGPALSGEASADNTGSRSTGVERVSLAAAWNSPTGRGDLTQALVMHTRGSDYLRAAYTLPVGDRGLRLAASLGHLDYRVVGADLAAAGASGRSTTFGLDASYPWLRSRLANVQLTAGLEARRFDNRSGGVTASRYATRGLTLGLSGYRFDEFAGGGSSAASLALTQGQVDLGGSPNEAADAASLRTAGSFRRVRYSLTRQQVIRGPWQFYAALNGQLASRNLDSSEKFYLGGSGGVRAYPSSEGGGSEGHLLALELRTRVGDTLGLSAFYDHGRVRVNRDNAITGAAALNTFALRGAGLSASWATPAGVNLKATLARRIGANPNPTAAGTDQDGSLTKNRLWLQASLPF